MVLLQIVYAVRAKTTTTIDLRNVEENGAKMMATAFQVRPITKFSGFYIVTGLVAGPAAQQSFSLLQTPFRFTPRLFMQPCVSKLMPAPELAEHLCSW